jgi:hypothetical protein
LQIQARLAFVECCIRNLQRPLLQRKSNFRHITLFVIIITAERIPAQLADSVDACLSRSCQGPEQQLIRNM